MKPFAQVAAELGKLPEKNNVRTRALRTPHPDARQEEDSSYRAAYGVDGRRPYGRPLRSAFYEYLPDAPSSAYLGKDDAARYLAQIHTVIEMQCWTRREQERLRVLCRRWEKRARGEDPRYVKMGTLGGVSEANRRKTAADSICAIRNAILASGGQVAQPSVPFMQDAKWPFGRPNPAHRK
jgi:hypothetical protein